MAKQTSFHLLRDLSDEQEQKELEKLGGMQRKQKTLQEQLEALLQYRQDYLQKLQNAMSSGVRSSVAANAQRFIDNIDLAIIKQRTQIDAMEQALAAQRSLWLEQRRKRQSMETLITRQDQKQETTLLRREQRQHDEFAGQNAFRKMRLA